jgi:hypothetical protein
LRDGTGDFFGRRFGLGSGVDGLILLEATVAFAYETLDLYTTLARGQYGKRGRQTVANFRVRFATPMIVVSFKDK